MTEPSSSRRSKALLIGCGYPGTAYKLHEPITDAKAFARLLVSKYGFKVTTNRIRLMLDDGSTLLSPTRQNILDGMRWLVRGAKPGDRLLLVFSGHGTQLVAASAAAVAEAAAAGAVAEAEAAEAGAAAAADGGGTARASTKKTTATAVLSPFLEERSAAARVFMDFHEIDGLDECIVPTDVSTSGIITDNEMHHTLVRPLAGVPGAQLTAVLDCCRSGTALDLHHLYVEPYSESVPDCEEHLLETVETAGITATHQQQQQQSNSYRAELGNVFLISGCLDDEFSHTSDGRVPPLGISVLTSGVLSILGAEPETTLDKLCTGLRLKIPPFLRQTPQLSSLRPVDFSTFKFF